MSNTDNSLAANMAVAMKLKVPCGCSSVQANVVLSKSAIEGGTPEAVLNRATQFMTDTFNQICHTASVLAPGTFTIEDTPMEAQRFIAVPHDIRNLKIVAALPGIGELCVSLHYDAKVSKIKEVVAVPSERLSVLNSMFVALHEESTIEEVGIKNGDTLYLAFKMV